MPPTSVIVHPLVLLSAVDHYTRVAQDTQKRVVGVLLGSSRGGIVDVSNSYAVPFDEDEHNPKVWYFDHTYHENMYDMYHKVNAMEKVIGWYSTGPKLRANDISIHQIMKRFCDDPVLVIINVDPQEVSLPTEAYYAAPQVQEDGTEVMVFHHVPSSIGAVEAEEIGTEHLLRDIRDAGESSLGTRVRQRLSALKGLMDRLKEMDVYLDRVLEGTLPVNQTILASIQNIFNLMPDLTMDETIKAFAVKTNDAMLSIYVGSMIRSVVALHDLIDNKLANKRLEQEA